MRRIDTTKNSLENKQELEEISEEGEEEVYNYLNNHLKFSCKVARMYVLTHSLTLLILSQPDLTLISPKEFTETFN